MPAEQTQAVGQIRILDDVRYGAAPVAGAVQDLLCRLYLPEGRKVPPPLLAWFHGGAFVTGHHRQYGCDRIGQRMARAGVAVASVGYRLKARPEDLSADVRAFAAAQANQVGPHLRGNLCNHRALAAMEDGVSFARWAMDNTATYGWSGALVLGGNSAGAITALNMLFTAPAIGVSRPEIRGVYGCSAGYNYPALVTEAQARDMVFLHNPDDHRVPVSGVRMLKQALPERVELLESADHIHGHFELTGAERPRAAFRRLTGFIDRVAGK